LCMSVDPSTIAPLLAVALGGLTGVAGWVIQPRFRSKERSSSTEITLEQRIQALAETMRSSARLVEQVTAEIEARAATAERLRDEAQAAEQLAQLSKAERDAVARLVRAEVSDQNRKSTRLSFVASALFFVAGVAATVAVALLVHPLH
jgi:TolA-binding protein